MTESQYEIVDKQASSCKEWDPLMLEAAKLYELACKREQQYRQQSITDSLTEISNRRHALEEGTRAFLRAQRHHLLLSILMVDIDHFKRINDT